MASLSSNPSGLSNRLETTNVVYSTQKTHIKELKLQAHISDLTANEETELVHDIVLNQSFHRIYIFDFDDTIFPTSILQKNTKIWDHTELDNLSEYKQCNTLYNTIKQCVHYMLNLHHKLCTTYGADNIDIVIITNASHIWLDDIKLNHSSLISELLIKMESVIPIISAKDEFEENYDDWYSECATIAKTDSFTNYIESLRLEHKIPILYSIGDGKSEHEASKITMEDLFDDEVSMLHRVMMKSNRKSNRKVFKSLGKFYDTLKETLPYLLHTDEALRAILKGNKDTEQGSVIDTRL